MRELPEGQKVLITIAGVVDRHAIANGTRAYLSLPQAEDLELGDLWLKDPTIGVELVEDLRPGDVVLDAEAAWFQRLDFSESGFRWSSFNSRWQDEDVAIRPFKLHFRDGKPVTP